MTVPSPIDETQLLRDARSKAERLMVNLIAQRDDLERFAPQIDPDKRALGQQAFANAIDSIRKTLDGIDQALGHTTLQAE
jgi:hypothetical protein